MNVDNSLRSLCRGRGAAYRSLSRAPRAPLVTKTRCLGLATGLAVLLSGLAAASGQTLDMRRFRPGPGPGLLVAEERPEILPHLGWGAGAWLQVVGEPLVFESAREGTVPVVESMTTLDLTAAVGLADVVELGVVMPLALSMTGEAPPADEAHGLPGADGGGLGDLRIQVKLAAVKDAGPFSLSLYGRLVTPTGAKDSYLSDEAVGGTVGATTGLNFGRSELVLAGGYRLRQAQALPGTLIGDELVFAAGGRVKLVPDRVDLRGELAGGTGVGELSFGGENETSLEGRVGIVWWPLPTVGVQLAGGVPVLHGVGTPAYRVMGGIYVSPRDYDRDRDGLPDESDRCPDRAEDLDGYEDGDGCPDLDNDGDRVPDLSDRCPMEPEDDDGFEDSDGCPDEDNDGDGVSDLDDGCPSAPEEVDGFQDDDGCPDPDNDEDGVPDGADVCPFEAEDKDGHKDADGCPDNDNDEDGIPDAADRCPAKAEVYNAKDDGDGCPDDGASLVRLEGDLLVTATPLTFVKGESQLKRSAEKGLAHLGSLLQHHQGVLKVRLVGFAEDGEAADPKARVALADERAQTVLAMLLEEGASLEKMEAVSGLAAPTPAPKEEGAAKPAPAAELELRKRLRPGEGVLVVVIERAGS